MALDIQNGDQLVIDSVIYAITDVSHYDAHHFGKSHNFAHWATIACSTNRRGEVVSGKEPAPTENLTGIYCTPLVTVTAQTRQTPVTNTPMVLLETFITDATDYVRLEIQENKVG